jgi:hypothetical protein
MLGVQVFIGLYIWQAIGIELDQSRVESRVVVLVSCALGIRDAPQARLFDALEIKQGLMRRKIEVVGTAMVDCALQNKRHRPMNIQQRISR